jgi:hypothetical protein
MPSADKLPISVIATGTPDGTKFVRDDGTLAAPASGSNRLGQVVTYQTGTAASGTTAIPFDNTIPQNTEGDQYMTLAITPANASSQLIIEVTAFLASNTAQQMCVALFQDTTAGALAVAAETTTAANVASMIPMKYVMTAGTTSATTFKIRCGGNNAGTTSFNQINGIQAYGGVMQSRITITEILP